jgi:parvulin-like peptidyl-prolyl isomerase
MSKKIALLLLPGLALLLSLGSGCKAPEKSVVSDVPAGKTAPGPQAANPQSPSGATPSVAPGQQQAPLTLPGAKPGTPAPAALAPDKIPTVVARVNGKEIKKIDLLDGAQMVQVRMAQVGRPVNPTADLYREVLKQLIDINLLQQDAKAQGVTVPEDEVQKAVAARKRSFPSEEVYKKALAQAGVTEKDLRDRAHDQLMLQKYVETKLAPKATVPDQAVRDFYDKHQDEMKVPERLRLRHIFIAADAKASPADREKAKQKAQDALKRLQGGEDFAKLAQQLSDDPGSKTRGGDLGPIAKGQTPPPFEAAAFALKKPNDLSPVVESNAGYHVIQLVERIEPSVLPFEQVKDRIAALLKQQEVQKIFQDRAAQLRAKSKVETFI